MLQKHEPSSLFLFQNLCYAFTKSLLMRRIENKFWEKWMLECWLMYAEAGSQSEPWPGLRGSSSWSPPPLIYNTKPPDLVSTSYPPPDTRSLNRGPENHNTGLRGSSSWSPPPLNEDQGHGTQCSDSWTRYLRG